MRRRRVSRAGELLLTALGQGVHETFSENSFAAFDLGHAVSEAGVEQRSGLLGQLFFNVEEVEGVGDDLGWLLELAEFDEALDALFGGGVKGDRRGGSIRRAGGAEGGGASLRRSGGPYFDYGS